MAIGVFEPEIANLEFKFPYYCDNGGAFFAKDKKTLMGIIPFWVKRYGLTQLILIPSCPELMRDVNIKKVDK